MQIYKTPSENPRALNKKAGISHTDKILIFCGFQPHYLKFI
jgi:hypothetical protein